MMSRVSGGVSIHFPTLGGELSTRHPVSIVPARDARETDRNVEIPRQSIHNGTVGAPT
jgi:hypothetical protein